MSRCVAMHEQSSIECVGFIDIPVHAYIPVLHISFIVVLMHRI